MERCAGVRLSAKVRISENKRKIRLQFYPLCANVTVRERRDKETRFYTTTPAPDVADEVDDASDARIRAEAPAN